MSVEWLLGVDLRQREQVEEMERLQTLLTWVLPAGKSPSPAQTPLGSVPLFKCPLPPTAATFSISSLQEPSHAPEDGPSLMPQRCRRGGMLATYMGWIPAQLLSFQVGATPLSPPFTFSL